MKSDLMIFWPTNRYIYMPLHSYKNISHLLRDIEILLEHATIVNTLEVTNYLRLWRSVACPNVGDLHFIDPITIIHYSQQFQKSSALSGYSDIFIMYKKISIFIFLLNKKHVNGGGHWWRNSQGMVNCGFIQTASFYL